MRAAAGKAHTGDGLLSTYLLSESPGSIVLIGSQQIDMAWPDGTELPPVLHCEALADCSSIKPVAPVVAILQLDNQIQSLDETLGHAVRLFPGQLLVRLDAVTSPDQTFFAFGFRRLNVVNSGSRSKRTRWFEYRLSTYKSSPDWLNTRFWANPERFEVDDDLDMFIDDEDDED